MIICCCFFHLKFWQNLVFSSKIWTWNLLKSHKILKSVATLDDNCPILFALFSFLKNLWVSKRGKKRMLAKFLAARWQILGICLERWTYFYFFVILLFFVDVFVNFVTDPTLLNPDTLVLKLTSCFFVKLTVLHLRLYFICIIGSYYDAS